MVQITSLISRRSMVGADGSWVDLLPSTKPVQRGLQPRRPHPFHPNMQVLSNTTVDLSAQVRRQRHSHMWQTASHQSLHQHNRPMLHGRCGVGSAMKRVQSY